MAFSSESRPRQISDIRELTVGDVLLRRKSSVMHVGIYVGDGMVFDNAPSRGESLVDFATFAKDNPVFAISTHLPPDAVQAQVKERLKQAKPYHLFNLNCEHSVRQVLGSEMISMQLREVEEWAMLGAAFAKGLGRHWMWAGALCGAAIGTLSLPRMKWLKHKA